MKTFGSPEWFDVHDTVNAFLTGGLTRQDMAARIVSPEFLTEVSDQVDERYHIMSKAMRLDTLERLEESMHNGGYAMTKAEIEELEDLRGFIGDWGGTVTVV